jgi:branched-chain amino acid transport system substrate-binding protein
MRLRELILSAALGAIAGTPAFVPAALAQNSIYVPLFIYRTVAFAGGGISIVNGTSDYLNMPNERDGGIGRVKLAVEESETGYDTVCDDRRMVCAPQLW